MTNNATNFKGTKLDMYKVYELVRRTYEKLADYFTSETI